MSEQIRVHNPNVSSVVIDLEGHSLGGHTAVLVEPDKLTQSLIDSGRLLERPGVRRAKPAADKVPTEATKSKRKTTADNGTESGE